MQVYSKKKYIFFLISFFCGVFIQIQATVFESDRQYADSLFAEKKYTQAFEVYEQLVHEHQVFSPRMLLKMAYVKEGIGDFPSALYYLSLYYRYSPQLDVLKKMEKMATEQGYEGYAYSDHAFFKTAFAQYRFPVTLAFISIALVWLIFLFVRKRKGQEIRAAGLGLLFFLTLTGGWYNLPIHEPQVVIQEDSVYLMDSPSAGAKVVAVVDEGHRLPVIGEAKDIWYPVLWQGEPAYLRRHTVQLIP